MLPEPIPFVIQPNRIANVVHYLTHGRTLNPIITDEAAFYDLLAKLKKQAGQKPSWKPTPLPLVAKVMVKKKKVFKKAVELERKGKAALEELTSKETTWESTK